MAGAVADGSSAGAVGPSSQGPAVLAGPGPGLVLWTLADAMPGQPAAATISAMMAPSAGAGSRRARRRERGCCCAGVSPWGRLLPNSTRVTILILARRTYPI